MSHVRRVRLWAVATVAIAAVNAVSLAGCGFVGANDKSSVKPNGFVLFGHAAVPLPTNDHRANGTSCVSPIVGVAPGTSVKILDPTGRLLGTTYLGDGVIGRDTDGPTCNVPFSVDAIPGGVASYAVKIGTRSAQQFAATTLRENNPAVITITR